MNANEIIEAAKRDGLSRRQVKDLCYAAGIAGAERQAVWDACGCSRQEPAAPKQVTASPSPAPAAPNERAVTRANANKYPGRCKLTDQQVAAGDGACLKYGSTWCVLGPVALSVCLLPGDERKLLSACMIAGGADDPTALLDHEDYELMANLQAACEAAGINTICKAWSGVLV